MNISMIFILTGIAFIIGAQFMAFLMAISLRQTGEAIKSLVIPLYQWVYVRKEPKAKPLLWVTIVGIFCLIFGVVLSS